MDGLLRAYGRDILHFIRFYTKNNNEAEDLTQEVFIRAYKNIAAFRSDCDAKTWLLKIAVNVCRNFARWQQRHPAFPVDIFPITLISPSAESEVLRRSDEMSIAYQVQELPVKLKEVVLLHYFEDKSINEIAKMLGILEGAVKVRLFRARKLLKQREEGLAHEERSDQRQLKKLAPHR